MKNPGPLAPGLAPLVTGAAMKPGQGFLDQPARVRMALLVVVALGFLARLPGLGGDLSWEETFTFYAARGVDIETTVVTNGPAVSQDALKRRGRGQAVMQATSHSEYHPPLYFLLLHAWTGLAGESNRSLRLLSVLFATATIPAAFSLGRGLFGEKTGLAAAGILAFLPSHVEVSHQLRPYALAVLLATAASWAYWRAWLATGHPGEGRRWCLYGSLAAAAVYTHYLAAGVLLAHGCFALLPAQAARAALLRRLTAVAAAIFLLFTPWLFGPYFKNELRQEALSSRDARVYWSAEHSRHLLKLPYYVEAGYLWGKRLYIPVAFSVYLLSAGVLFYAARRRELPAAPTLLSLFLLALPMFSVFLLAEAFGSTWVLRPTSWRYALFAAPGFCLLVGTALVASGHAESAQGAGARPPAPRAGLARAVAWLIGGAALALFLLFLGNWQGRQWHYGDGSVSAAVDALSRKARPGQLVVFEDRFLLAQWNIYESRPRPQLVLGGAGSPFAPVMEFESRWRDIQRRYSDLYLVRWANQPPSEAFLRLHANYRLLSREQVADWWEIRYYQRPPLDAAHQP